MPLAAADAAALADGLRAAAGQGWLRDIEVSCQNVPSGAVVQDGSGELFEHVHEDEYNVYDFTDVHAAAGWQKRGAELHFPEGADVSHWELGAGRLAARSGLMGRLDQAVQLEDLHAPLQVHAMFDAFSEGQTNDTHYEVCGSPYEVANKPSTGHHMPFHMSENAFNSSIDTEYDGRYLNARAAGPEAKRNIWLNKALYGEDQLRQRMAWALSAIIPVSPFNFDSNLMTEMHVTFYDIFVRHAFGNYRDIMREMTWSPLMANWLTYVNNKAVDVDGMFPDENYAREIMQVFSIGICKLHRDGSKWKDESGNDVRTYDNWNIQEFARIFTGLREQVKRGNIEDNGMLKNLIDPLRMEANWHDSYPKRNLDGAYIGDRLPLCRDRPEQAFLWAKAKFLFIGGNSTDPEALELDEASPLFVKLCGGPSAPCEFKSAIELDAAVTCQGSECTATHVKTIKVAGNFYEYIEPPCVYPFFWDTGRTMRWAKGSDYWDAPTWAKCMEPTETKAAGAACCKGCTNAANPWMVNHGFTCEDVESAYPGFLDSRCGPTGSWSGPKYCAMQCWRKGKAYAGDDCSAGNRTHQHACVVPRETMTYPDAVRRCATLGMQPCRRFTQSNACGYEDDYLWTRDTCTVKIIVHADGRVSVNWDGMAKKSKFAVPWKSGFPVQDEGGACPTGCTPEGESCSCTATAHEAAVFTSLPTEGQIKESLHVGAWSPTAACIEGCGGIVEAYSASGSIDKDTIFQCCGGKYYLNIALTVKLPQHEFRNLPVFTLWKGGRPKKANDEIEALIDHLFHHENTPQFLAYRLIQRLTTSNPSPTYIFVVQHAFRTGYFNGTKYSGQYGDLGATVAAILLFPEARQGGNVSGSLREPLNKVVHFMRSMEFRDDGGREVVMSDMMNKIGQWPYSAIDVFNFFHPGFHPEGFPDEVVGPEFQILTMPNVMNYINGMTSMIKFGLGSCAAGFGWQQYSGCTSGSFKYSKASSKNAMIQEMDLLLTGGRLGMDATAVLSQEYDKATTGKELEALQYASFLTPAFHTLGDTSLPTSPAPAPVPVSVTTPRNYRAMVMLFMQGGVDSFQYLVPMNCPVHHEYRAIRESIALLPEQLLSISTTGQNCSTFGVHPSMSFLRDTYNNNKAAFISNVGNLLEPLTAKKFHENGKRCNGLFSHIDQQRAAQTLTCQTATPIYKGAGGRLADALANGPHAYRTESFSLNGRSKWSLGHQTVPKIISSTSGNIPLKQPSKITTVLDNITSVKHTNIFCEEYRRQLKDAIDLNTELGTTLENAVLSTDFDAGNSMLSQQLRQAARLISQHVERKVERDIFWVELAGFDHHQGVMAGLDAMLPQVDEALRLFVNELEGQGNFDKVTLVSHSDFGRTLAPNSNSGTDHGWAGHHFIVGGAVNGGKVYNKYPETLLPGHAMDIHHGRIIPEYPWESIMVPLAEWMGMENDQKSGVFPNIDNFNSSYHILSRSTVFSN